MYFAVADLAVAFLSFAPSSVDPQILLNQVRQEVAGMVRAAPRYTCTETIEGS